jgi:DNA-binding winged helix-turn-helix (wHTH) protein/TolB-like protein
MTNPEQYRAYRFGSFTLDLDRGALLTTDGNEMPLRPKSFALLRLLAENAGRLLSRETIMEALWPNIYVTDDNVTQCIHEIRGALGTASGQLLRTLPRRGYLFTPDVIALPAADSAHTGPPVADDPEHRKTRPTSVENGAMEPASPPNHAIARRTLARTSLFVAPLRNLGVPKAHEYLLAAIPEDICHDLSIYRGLLEVVGAPEAGRPDADAAGPRAVGRELGVGYVLDGSIRGIADRLAVNVQLVDVATGVHLWSEQFDIDLGGTTDTRNEVASRVALTIFPQVVDHVSQGLEAVPPEDWTADDLVIRGTALLTRPVTAQIGPESNVQDALGHFEKALVASPRSIRAMLGIARVLVLRVSFGRGPRGGPDEVRAEQLLADVLAVDGDNVQAFILIGIIRRTQIRLNDSLDAFRVALQLAPNHAPLISELGFTLALLGQPDTALPLIERSLRIYPRGYYAPISHACLGLCHLLKGHAATAIPSLRTARAMNPGMSHIHLWLAAALGLNGALDEASAALKQALAIQPDVMRVILRDRLLARRAAPEYVALVRSTVYAGLLRAGLPDVMAEADARSPDAEGRKEP